MIRVGSAGAAIRLPCRVRRLGSGRIAAWSGGASVVPGLRGVMHLRLPQPSFGGADRLSLITSSPVTSSPVASSPGGPSPVALSPTAWPVPEATIYKPSAGRHHSKAVRMAAAVVLPGLPGRCTVPANPTARLSVQAGRSKGRLRDFFYIEPNDASQGDQDRRDGCSTAIGSYPLGPSGRQGFYRLLGSLGTQRQRRDEEAGGCLGAEESGGGAGGLHYRCWTEEPVDHCRRGAGQDRARRAAVPDLGGAEQVGAARAGRRRDAAADRAVWQGQPSLRVSRQDQGTLAGGADQHRELSTRVPVAASAF